LISVLISTLLISPVYATAEEDFESLFFGTGAWLGLLLFMILCVVLVTISKYCVVFVIIIAVMMEMEYYTRYTEYGLHVWKMVILLFFALFLSIASLTGKIGNKR